MTCNEVRDILSDLIDVRNGEMPAAGESRLAETGMRAQSEAHLASCQECRAEMAILESVGSIFSDFSVGELPPQHFSNYGQIVRDRIQREKVIQMPVRKNIFSRWGKIAAATAVAACLAFAVVRFVPVKSPKPTGQLADNKSSKPSKIAAPKLPALAHNNTPAVTPRFNVKLPMNGVMPVASDFIYNPAEPKPIIETLTKDERKYGYLVLSEKNQAGEAPLLGLALRTTRDEDRDLSNKDSLGLKIHDIQPGSVAYEMGLMTNDLIVTINGVKISSGVEDAVKLLTVVHDLGAGATVDIDFVRRDEGGFAYHVRKGVLGDPEATKIKVSE